MKESENKEEKREKVTIKEVLKEYELANFGLTISVDGTPVDTFNKTMDFYRDTGRGKELNIGQYKINTAKKFGTKLWTEKLEWPMERSYEKRFLPLK